MKTGLGNVCVLPEKCVPLEPGRRQHLHSGGRGGSTIVNLATRHTSATGLDNGLLAASYLLVSICTVNQTEASGKQGALRSCRQATTLSTSTERVLQFTTKKNTAWSPPDLPEAPNTTILGQGHAPETENVTENTDGVGAGAKRDNFFLKQARRKDSEKPSKSHRKTDEQQERLSAENGEERSRRRDRRSSKGRSFSRSHSKEKRHRSRSRDKRRSRSHSRDKKKKTVARSHSRSRSKHRHHSRSRSKSRERKKRTEKVRRKSRSRSANPPAFRGRNTAMDAQEALARRLERAKKLQEQKEKEMLEKRQQQEQEIAAAAAPIAAAAVAAASSNPALNVAALLASGTQVTPQIAMAAQMAALQAKTLAETGIAVPSYYNPSAVNPSKFAEQEKKRKMLWQGKKDGDKSQTAELWEKLNFGNKDQNVKFRKLMGIRADEEGEASKPLNDEGLKTLQKQEEMFRNLDVQYEMARSQTHTQRGMGLGFSSSFSRGMDSI